MIRAVLMEVEKETVMLIQTTTLFSGRSCYSVSTEKTLARELRQLCGLLDVLEYAIVLVTSALGTRTHGENVWRRLESHTAFLPRFGMLGRC